MRSALAAFIRCERGATAIEYALIAGGIALVIIPTVYLLGSTLNTLFFERISDAVADTAN